MSTVPSPPQRKRTLDRVVLGLFLFLAVNGAYLGAFAAPTLPYMGNVLLHVLAGGAAFILYLFVAPRLLRSEELSRAARVAAALGLPLMLGAGLTGLYLARFYAIRPHRWILQLHVVLAVAAALAWAFYLRDRARTSGGGWATAWRYTARTGVGALVIFAVLRLTVGNPKDPRDIIRNPEGPPLEMAAESMHGKEGPFFPSSVHTTTGGRIPSNFFMKETSQTCGRSGCHPDIYKQWNSSAHHFSSFNNQWYRKSVEYMQEMVGTTPSRWCGGCHDPAILLNGMMDTPIKEIVNRPEAQAGLGCTACHSVIRVGSTMGQGDLLIEYPPLHDLSTSRNPIMRKLHDYLVRVNPEPHRRVFLKPFHTQQRAEFCSSCHKVHLDVPVNHYRWFRGFNDYDNWQASGVSGQGARSFYYPPQPSDCVNCHMPLVKSDDLGGHDGQVHSHRFPAANTALPVANRDPEQLKTVVEFLKAGRVTVDLFGIAEVGPEGGTEEAKATPDSGSPELSSFFAIGEEQASGGAGTSAPGRPPAAPVRAPIERLTAGVPRGRPLRVEVVARTRTVGHFFPGGTVDAFDVWTELKAVDATGRIVYWSGYVDQEGRGPVDPSAHFYKSFLLDANANPINKRNAWAGRAVLYVNLIPPGAADTVHFRMVVPPDAVSPLSLTARINYRKFAWWNTQWAYAGIRDPEHAEYASSRDFDDGRWVFRGDTSGVSGQVKEIPDLPIVTLAEAHADLPLLSAGQDAAAAGPVPRPEDRERWNDYGIGLLLQGDLRGAEAAFVKVTEIDPQYADGWLNAARALIAEGNLDRAQVMLDQALRLGPELARAHFFQGEVYRSRGRYDDALVHLRRANQAYPRDRVVLNSMGRILFLQEKHAEAVETLKKVLVVDPEDLQAHYTLMLAYGALGRKAESERERQLYLRFKANESAQEITGKYRLDHPHENNERQRIHEHRTHYAGPGVEAPAYAAAPPR